MTQYQRPYGHIGVSTQGLVDVGSRVPGGRLLEAYLHYVDERQQAEEVSLSPCPVRVMAQGTRRPTPWMLRSGLLKMRVVRIVDDPICNPLFLFLLRLLFFKLYLLFHQ